MKKKPPPLPPLLPCLADSAFALIAERGWDGLTFAQLAKRVKRTEASLRQQFPQKESLLSFLVDSISKDVPAASGDLSPHDRLFDVLMNRFEVLQQRRSAILKIIDAAKRDPALLRSLIPAQTHAMEKMLKQAGSQSDRLTTLGLLGLYALTVNVWRKDETRDLAKTMSFLDRNLKRAETFARLLSGSLLQSYCAAKKSA